jgi:two-component system, cell cycle sensor histidine kinase and response regulator CckA
MIATTPTDPHDILIVEDSLTQTEQLKFTLEENGYLTRCARNGVEALTLLKQRKPLLVISDINMPQMDGYELCRRIRADAALADLPVILLTSLSDADDVVLGLECGADNFVTKPHDNDYLISRIRYVMANRHLRSLETARISLEIVVGGRKHMITADRLQILHLLLSTYESAVLRNKQLIHVQEELRRLNENLEEKVRERTAALTAEIAERIRADEERARLLHERESLLESTSDGIYGVDANGRCTFINQTGAEMLGYAASELRGEKMHEVVQPLRADGTVYAAADSPISKAYVNGQPCRVESEVFWRRDGRSFPVEYSACAIREEGGVRGAVVTFRDITEKKKLEAEVLRAHRVESVGRLASGIAHDMNNILAPILMAAPLLRMRLNPDEAAETLNTIEISAQRGADLVRQLLIFGRGIEGERGPVSLPELLREIVKIAQQTFPKNITINAAVAADLWAVHGDATQLHQVLLNLCVNARDAMPKGGTLSLAAQNLELDASYAAMHLDAKPGPHVMLSVSDTGIGIPAGIAEKIFEPFFTTKAIGSGTGLGLSTVLGIVKSHGGWVRLRSEPGHGATFEVYLPALLAKKSTQVAEHGDVPKGNGELILVVDDEESIRCVLAETLVRHNYRVVTASDGAEASAIFARRSAEIALVITDLDMPYLDGVNLVRALRRMQPDIKVVVSSGLGDSSASSARLAELKALGVETILAKPYTADQILTTAHHVLTTSNVASCAAK